MKAEVNISYARKGPNGLVIGPLDPSALPKNVVQNADKSFTVTPVDLNPDGTVPDGIAVPVVAILNPNGFRDADTQWEQQVAAKLAEPRLTQAWNRRVLTGARTDVEAAITRNETPDAVLDAKLKADIAAATARSDSLKLSSVQSGDVA